MDFLGVVEGGNRDPDKLSSHHLHISYGVPDKPKASSLLKWKGPYALKPSAPSSARPGFSFALPTNFGSEEPQANNCCEVYGQLENVSSDEVLSAKRLIIVGAQKAATTFLYTALTLSP